MESLGEFLRRERELRKVTLREISAVTKIRLSYLDALEKGDHGNLPGRAYSRGFAKAYARCLGIDFAEVEARLGEPKQPSMSSAVSLPARQKHRRWPWLLLVCILALVLIFLVILYYVSLDDRLAGNSLISGRSDTGELVFGQDAAGAPIVSRPHELEIKATALTWLAVKADGQKAREMLLRPGKGVNLRAGELFDMVIGNAAGINLQLNGRALGSLGEAGQVVRLTLP
jgi:cytoskeletal protein RodZ